MRPRRVVIWGHPLHSHTHSYIHEGFARAFVSLGIETIWTADPQALAGLDLDGTLFITEGQVISGMPYDSRARYVVHNVDASWWRGGERSALVLQVYTNAPRERFEAGLSIERLDAYTYVERDDRGIVTLYQPWASDLLPHEFDFDVALPPVWPAGEMDGLPASPYFAAWVGTIGDGVFGNRPQLSGFFEACESHGIDLLHRASVDRATHMCVVRSSLLAPAIVGAWQLERGYIPCRIFKNISYGRLGVTNSPHVQEIFESEVLCRGDGGDLFEVAIERARERALLREQMLEVQARHTYLNRIETILALLT
ncbi:MAG TPA: hypothetical protein VGG41_18680 [Solirubrobacteraceae bacterium]|jgi:hypothetical protein